MARVLFVQDIYYQNLGPMYLSAALKERGHEVGMLVTNRPRTVEQHLADVDVVAFSCTTGSHLVSLELARSIKSHRPDVFVIMGGAHPTFYPEVLTQNPSLDAICRGEGEHAMLELCNGLPDRKVVAGIMNLSVRVGDEIKRNPMRELGGIDDLPFPDRDIYGPLFRHSIQPVLTSRGCPFSCTFCFNNSYRKALRQDTEKGYFVRYRDIENVIEELVQMRASGTRRVQFRDESFLSNTAWVRSFLPRYTEKIGLPFTCQIRIDEITEEKAMLIKDAGVHCVFFGIESGNEEIRRKIINKRLKSEDIITGAEILKRQGIPFRTYNIIGFPTESIANVYETIYLNQQIGTDYPWVSLLMPYKGTEIYDYFEEYYSDADVSTLELFFPKSRYYKDNPQLVNIHHLFILYVKFKWLKPLLDRLSRLGPNGFFRMLFRLSYAYSSYKSERYSLFEFIKSALHLGFLKYSYGPYFGPGRAERGPVGDERPNPHGTEVI